MPPQLCNQETRTDQRAEQDAVYGACVPLQTKTSYCLR
jgi:hypothetical protein